MQKGAIQRKKDLTNLYSYQRRAEETPVVAPAGHSENACVRSHFSDLGQHLIGYIRSADIVVGCVAWLTDIEIIETLSQKKRVSIIVQKEDFLRPDLSTSKTQLRNVYERLCGFHEIDGDILPRNITALGQYPHDWSGQGVRCVGYRRDPKDRQHPNMHHKFFVFCEYGDVTFDDGYEQSYLKPYAIWTGSYNVTRNARLSRENAVYIEDDNISRSYFEEWSNMLSVSEPLNWESDWISPDPMAFFGT